VTITARAYVLFDDNDFYGYYSCLSRAYINEYMSCKNNRIEFASDCNVFPVEYLRVENNVLIGHNEFEIDDLHGFSVRGYCYIYNNRIENMGTFNENDGEAIMIEGPNSPYNFGSVISSGRNWIQIEPNINDLNGDRSVLKMHALRYGKLSIAITYGRGMGQIRRITALKDDKYILEKPWEVIPDETSICSVIAPMISPVYYKNIIVNCTKGLWFYGYIVDGVMAENESIDSLGLFIHSTYNALQSRLQFNWYNRMVGNEISGVSRKTNIASIAYNTGRNTDTMPGFTKGQFYSTQIYGTEIKNNIITGDKTKIPINTSVRMTEAPNVSGIVLYSASYSSYNDGKSVAGDGMNSMVTGNILNNLESAINISRCNYGQVLENNIFSGNNLNIKDYTQNGSNFEYSENTIIN